jgi:cobalt/nickel transport protein
MRNRRFLLPGLLVALLLAGVASSYASSLPDGLEHVAERSGFGHTADESSTSDSPLADYTTAGVEDARLSTGLAGVLGSLAVLLLAGGLFWLIRRRAPRADDDELVERDPADSRR